MLGVVLITLTSMPASIAAGGALPGFIISLVIIGIGTGGIKSNVSPLMAEQYRRKHPGVKTLPSGKRVIVDPKLTVQSIFNWFYWAINIGSLSAIATTNCEKYVGFWLAYLIPLIMFFGECAV